MAIWEKIMDLMLLFLPVFCLFLGLSAILWMIHWFLIRRGNNLDNESKFPRQIMIMGFTLLAFIAVILALPISESSRNQLMGLMGLLISGIIAFSSTTVVANFMAGIFLRITRQFKIGDFIRVGDHFGRVSERGLLHTEIQAESRELITLPNTLLISSPVTTVHSQGTIISITLSLGYDVHHAHVQPLLIKAAEESGLQEPFVHILELGNFSINYRISGLLTEVKWLITARSNLCRAVLNQLHHHDVEIMSPTFMNQRRLDNDKKIIPEIIREKKTEESWVAEDIVFDKAEQAEQIEMEKQKLIHNIQELEITQKGTSGTESKQIKEKIEKGRERLKTLEKTKVELTMENKIPEPETPDDQKTDK